MLGSLSEMPRFTHIRLLAFTPLGAKVSPLLLSERFYLSSRVLIASLGVTSTKVTWECAGLFFCFAFMLPVQGFEGAALQFLTYPRGWCRNTRRKTFLQHWNDQLTQKLVGVSSIRLSFTDVSTLYLRDRVCLQTSFFSRSLF